MFPNSSSRIDWNPIITVQKCSYQDVKRVLEQMKKDANDPKNGDDYRKHCFEAQLALEKVIPHW